MWAVYLMLLVLTVVRAAKLQYCQELLLRGSVLRKDVATVVFTMDGTCVSCYQESQKLVRLKTQMARLGHNADVLVAINDQHYDHESQLPSEVTIDFEEAWAKLGQLNGHIFVFDKCGKLAYEVITPWSRQVYPFAAMAVLSALYDAPCGECNVTSQAVHEFQEDLAQDISNRDRKVQVAEVVEDFEETELPRSKLPLTITIRERHEHILNGNRVTYDVVELKTNDPSYHGHGEAGQTVSELSGSISNGTGDPKHEDQTGSEPKYVSQAITTPRDISQGKNNSSAPTTTSETPQRDQKDFRDLLKRYQPLMKWKSCADLVMSIQV